MEMRLKKMYLDVRWKRICVFMRFLRDVRVELTGVSASKQEGEHKMTKLSLSEDICKHS